MISTKTFEIEMDRNEITKCRCGESYTYNQWIELELIGYQSTLDDEITYVEYRQCYCTSTLGRGVHHGAHGGTQSAVD